MPKPARVHAPPGDPPAADPPGADGERGAARRSEPTEATPRSALRYATDARTGLHARAARARRFAYRDTRGRALRARRAIERIRSLAIPPAWTDVWICADAARPPAGHRPRCARAASSTATTRAGARGRDADKFGHLREFGEALPAIRAQGA